MKFSVITMGCTLNRADSERMINILKSKGYEYTENPEESDILILNTCTVKTPSENKVYRYLRTFKDKKIILAGCLVQHLPEKFKDYPLVGVYQIYRIDEVVEGLLNGEIKQFLKKEKVNKLSISPLYKYPIKIIPVQEGCLWNCAYCATKLSRSLLQSFPPRIIYDEILDAVNKKIPIVYLTGTDLAAYGKDIGINLANLLDGIKEIEGTFFIRVGMANPGLLNEYMDDLLKAYEDPRVFKFFHIPVQSGSNKVLEDMGRKYTVEEFLESVDKIRKKYPYASIATDIIVGYPTETEEDFKKTIDLMKEVKFDVVNISRFWPRPKTKAFYLKKLPDNIVKDRSRLVTKVFNETALERNKQWINWEGWIVIESKGTKDSSWIGRNFAYKQVIVKSDENLLGKFVKVRITQVTPVDLRGKILEVKNDIDIEDWVSYESINEARIIN